MSVEEVSPVPERYCTDCIHYDECYVRFTECCEDYVSVDEYIERNRSAYRDDFYSYLDEFESC